MSSQNGKWRVCALLRRLICFPVALDPVVDAIDSVISQPVAPTSTVAADVVSNISVDFPSDVSEFGSVEITMHDPDANEIAVDLPDKDSDSDSSTSAVSTELDTDMEDDIELIMDLIAPRPAGFSRATRPHFDFVVMDDEADEIGVAFGVVPSSSLTYPTSFNAEHKKFYAVSYGWFVGVFNDPSMFSDATSRVSSPRHYTCKSLRDAVYWFNAQLALGRVEIA
ncbi:hypothetical protein BD626DRAFT_538972 [Schizophyllum amplum]|uniref:Uncharacterized protein n=1 Tax=Schizophyllum amplum TaxID=97359 RepID=A0A550C587_9AGAR|nr:hypothetical protein BD626DRAFT_538972 [Auriculariopsis ampla]